jgi:hypothetical protein
VSKEETQSEFGRGLLTCLLAFIEHRSQVERFFDPAALLTSHGIAGAMWANGAADHLLDLEIPPRLRGTDLSVRLKAFQKRWIHFRSMMSDSGEPTKEQILIGLEECGNLILEIAVELDKILGIENAEKGRW